jgi:hypothetical protein
MMPNTKQGGASPRLRPVPVPNPVVIAAGLIAITLATIALGWPLP